MKLNAELVRWAAGAVLAGATVATAAYAEPELVVSHGISAFGDLRYDQDFEHFGYVNADAPKGGQITLRARAGTFDNFNPYILRGDAEAGARFLFDSLMVRAYDEPDAVYGLLAESVEMPEDRSYAIFNLREEARFADGSPVTAEDVAWSIMTLRDKGAAASALALRNVTEISVLAPLRVRFDFREGEPTRDLAATVAQMPIFSKAHFDGGDFQEPSLTPPLGSGPYRVGEFEAGRYVTYQLREDYWARDLPSRRGQFNFGSLRYEYFLNHDAAFEAFLAGEFDLNEENYSKNWATRYEFEAINDGLVIKEVLPDGNPSFAYGFWINSRRPHLQDSRVRAAISLAFDFEWSNRALFYGLYQRSDSLFENTELQASGLPTDDELRLLEPFRDELPPEVFEELPYSPPLSDGTGRNRQNLRRAAALLEEAGYRVVEGRLLNENGEQLSLEFVDRIGPSVDRILNPYLQNLQRLGIDAQLRGVDATQYEQRLQQFDYDVTSFYLPMQPTPGSEIMDMLSSTSSEMAGSRNYAGVDSPAVDALVREMDTAQTRDQLRAAAHALDRVFRAAHFWTPQWHRPFHPIAYWNRFGRPQDLGIEKPPFHRAIVLTWWYDAERAARIDEDRDGG